MVSSGSHRIIACPFQVLAQESPDLRKVKREVDCAQLNFFSRDELRNLPYPCILSITSGIRIRYNLAVSDGQDRYIVFAFSFISFRICVHDAYPKWIRIKGTDISPGDISMTARSRNVQQAGSNWDGGKGRALSPPRKNWAPPADRDLPKAGGNWGGGHGRAPSPQRNNWAPPAGRDPLQAGGNWGCRQSRAVLPPRNTWAPPDQPHPYQAGGNLGGGQRQAP